MKVVSFSEVKDELIANMRKNSLIPIIGAGFTRKCHSRNGFVPAGEDYKKYMIDRIQDSLSLNDSEKSNLSSESFQNVSSIYHNVVEKSIQRQYLQTNFTRVQIEAHKQRFLSLPWPYLYTLNIDDGIENGSEYKQVICANREVDEQIFDDEHCVIKLHGDAHDMLSYKDADSEVFSQEQYVLSLKKNASLLSKLTHDSNFHNLLFIGCSLSDEIDLLYSIVPEKDSDIYTSKYVCQIKKPTVIEELKYKKYGITHCIIFDSFDSIYTELYGCGIEAQKVSEKDLLFHNIKFDVQVLSSDFEANKSYLLYGKSLIGNNTITIPHFFISRKESLQIINNFGVFPFQLLIGSRCSGKTYILADIARKVRDRDVYFFESKDRLSDEAFTQLLNKRNVIILADAGSFSSNQFEIILNNLSLFEIRKVSIVLAVNKSSRDVRSVLKLYEIQGRIDIRKIPQIEIDRTFTSQEIAEINPLLTAITVGVFSPKKSIADNIIEVSRNLDERNRYSSLKIRAKNTRELSALIALGIERKIYSSFATKLDLVHELYEECKAAAPLIDFESTWSFEKSNGDNSPTKYVVNAEYWLFKQLKSFASIEKHYDMIVEAFQYIISRIVTFEGMPNLLSGSRDTAYSEYVFFDNINRLFSFEKKSGKKGMSLIRVIYEGLNDYLSVDPNYMHQRAKCYIKSSYYEEEQGDKLSFLSKAYRDANVAMQIFKYRYENSSNEKLLISIDHIKYTQALILCHKCSIRGYTDIEDNTSAINTLSEALASPYNTYDFLKTDDLNYQDAIQNTVYYSMIHKDSILPEAYSSIQMLFKNMFSKNNA